MLYLEGGGLERGYVCGGGDDLISPMIGIMVRSYKHAEIPNRSPHLL